MSDSHASRNRAFYAIVVLSLLALCAAPWVGMQSIGWGDVFGPDAAAADIFWKLRVPRVATGFLAGCALGAAGAVFQSIFRNSLAEPFTLGVSAGASAGMVLAVFVGGGMALGGLVPVETVFAFCGALLAIYVVYAFSRSTAKSGGDSGSPSILLAGVAVSFFFSSVILLLQHMVDPHNAARMFRVTIGGMAGAGQRQLLLSLPFVLVGLAVAAAQWRELDILSCGEDIALTRGVETERVRRRLYFAVSLMVAGITALCGPVGFVGLAAPHVCRLLVGPGHARLLPAAALLGGAFLAVADLLARILVAPAELPVGVISSLCGAPFFFWLLLRGTK